MYLEENPTLANISFDINNCEEAGSLVEMTRVLK